MITETLAHTCRACGSIHIVKNGTNACGNQQYHCKDCGVYRVLEPQQQYSEEDKETILRAYKERGSMRGVSRIFGVARPTLAGWIKKKSSKRLS